MRIFISHSKSEKELARRLSQAIRDLGFEPRIDDLKYSCGEDNPGRVQQELRRRYDYMIPLLSPDYMADRFLQTELLQGLMLEQTVNSPFVLPVLVEDCNVWPLLEGRLMDFRNASFESAISVLSTRLSESRQVFVVMQFGDENLDSAYELAIKPVVKEFGYSPLRIDQVQDGGEITDQILKHIQRSSVVLADLTGGRPNCYFEVGYSLALDKELVLSARESDVVHFDLAGRRIIKWRTPTQLQDGLRLRFAAIRERQQVATSPLKHQT